VQSYLYSTEIDDESDKDVVFAYLFQVHHTRSTTVFITLHVSHVVNEILSRHESLRQN